MPVIYSALKKLSRIKAEKQAELAEPLAIAMTYWSASKGVKDAKSIWFNPWRRSLATEQALEIVDEVTAKTFLSLMQRGKVPTWVTQYVPMETIQLSAGE